VEGANLVASDEPLILALNCGSSSLKYGAYRAAECVFEGDAQEIKDHAAALTQALAQLASKGLNRFSKVGHRVVHGGPAVREHQILTDDVFAKLQAAVPFAPLHLPASLAVIAAVRKQMPDVPQVICLDTAFHRTMPDVARTFALPENVRKLGIERYGFHGLSLESIVAQLNPVPPKLVVAHLGNGSSITAIQNGESIDTTMGLTPTGGVMMGTRCGDLDPGVMIYLARHGFANPDELEDLVNRQSGSLGVSGISSDVRRLPPDDLSLRMFAYQVRQAIVAMVAALGGIDLLVFTGGIGEHADAVRQDICRNLTWIDPFEIRVLPALEDLQIVRIALSCSK
jgi:acetate kinase